MLIVYRKSTGVVVDNTGTNSAMPLGPGEDQAYINTDAKSISRKGLALFRLHDEEDVDLVERVLTNRHRIDISTTEPGLLIEGPYPPLPAANE